MALADNLVAFWKLGEVSGTRADSIGSNDLGDNNTVTQATGKVGNAAQFTRATSEHLGIADNTDMSAGDVDFTWAGWVYFDSTPPGASAFVFASKYRSSDDQREWGVEWLADTDRIRFFVSDDGTSGAHFFEVSAEELGSPATDTWYFIVVWHDSVNNTINIQIDDGPIDTLAHSAGVFDGTAEFRIGQLNDVSYMGGRIDAVGWWKRVLTQLERTQLYNDGNGLEPPFLVSTYTEAETVVVQVCDSDTGFGKEMILPRFAQEDDDVNSIAKFLDEQAEIIEDKYNSQVAREVPCEICVTSGAIVLDCGKCVHFEVAADADINSISFINCFPGDELDLLFRASKDIEITGWPSGFTCPTCGTAESPTEISSGNISRRRLAFAGGGSPIERDVSDVKELGSAGGGGGGAAQTGTCPCTPDDGGLLTVVVCTEIDCDASEPKIELTVCGGTAPYTWSVEGGETPTQTDSGIDDRNTKVEPPENTNPSEPGDAYAKGHGETRADVCPASLYNLGATYDCAGVQSGGCTQRACTQTGGCFPVVCEVCCNACSNQPQSCCLPIIVTPFCGVGCCDGSQACEQTTQDVRSQSQKDNGCKPCAATMQGVIISVTDSDGAVVSTVIETTLPSE